MSKNIKSFLKDQVDHLYRIQKLFMQILVEQTNMRSECNQIELLRLESVAQMNPVQDLLDFVNTVSPEDGISPWVKLGPSKEDNIELQTAARESNSLENETEKENEKEKEKETNNQSKDERIVSDLSVDVPTLTNSQLLTQYWDCAFPSLSITANHNGFGTVDSAEDKKDEQNDDDNDNDGNDNGNSKMNDNLMNETALDDNVRAFQSLFNPNAVEVSTIDDMSGLSSEEKIKLKAKERSLMEAVVPQMSLKDESLGRQRDFNDFQSKRLQLEIDQLFPPDIPIKNLNAFGLDGQDWHRMLFETMFLSSRFFKTLNPHISYVWQIVIPNKLGIDNTEIKSLTNANLPPVKGLNHPRYDFVVIVVIIVLLLL